MVARAGQGSTLQVVAGILIVSILVLILFITQTTTSAETLEQSSQSSQAFRTNIHVNNIIATSYYLDNYNSITMGGAISYWCKYGDDVGIIGEHLSDDQQVFTPIEQVHMRQYLQRLLDRTMDSQYRLEIDCNPKADAFNKRTTSFGETPPATGTIYSAETVIHDQTNTNHNIEVRLYTWN